MPEPAPARVCILAGTFFPFPQVASVRMTHWARGLAAAGTEVLVLTRDYGHRASADTLAREVHPGVRVIAMSGRGEVVPAGPNAAPAAAGRVAKPRPVKNFLFNRGQLVLVPDSQVLFWRRARAAMAEAIRGFGPEVVISSSPMTSVHAAGRWAHRTFSLPWLADFRDPYLVDPRFRPTGIDRLAWPRHARFERSIYREAAVVTHAIPLHHRWARRHHAGSGAAMELLPHALPEIPRVQAAAVSGSEGRGSKTVCIVGAIGDEELAFLHRLCGELAAEGEPIRLRLVGKITPSAAALPRLGGVEVTSTGRLRHDRALQEIAAANVLVNAVSKERQRNLLVSSKLFEYGATDKPVLCFHPTRSDRHLLRQLPGATVIRVSESEESLITLRRMLRGEELDLGAARRPFQERYAWKRHMEHLQRCLGSCLRGGGS